MLAFCYAVVCAIHRGDDLAPFKDIALTTQVRFHVVKDKIDVIAARIQYREHVSATEKALGPSALYEAEQIIAVMTALQLKKGSDGKVENPKSQAPLPSAPAFEI
jgi:hypothetical protein